MEPYILSTGSEVLDGLLGGGWESGMVNTIYGPASSGKTTCCLMSSVACARQGFKVVYVDTENGFNTERLKQIAGEGWEAILERILVIKVKSFKEQSAKIPLLHDFARQDKIRLFVIDTIGKHYRVELNDAPKEVNNEAVEQLRKIHHLAKDFNKAVLMANQVYSIMGPGDVKSVEMVGGKMMKVKSHSITELNFTPSKQRYLTLKKYKSDSRNFDDMIDRIVTFSINDKGIVHG